MAENRYAALKRDNEARLLRAEREGRGVVDAWPATMVFEFTAACNLHCFMCGFEMLRDELRLEGRTKFTLPVETFRMVADKAFPHVRLVNPTVGGEPFVLPYFDELLEKVAHYGCKLELVSNGMLLRGERMRKLMPHLGIITISFDGATKETFEYVRTGARFEQVMENLEEFARLRRELGFENRIGFNFNVTLLRENVAELPEIIEIAARLGVGTVMATYMVVTAERVRDSSPANCPAETNRALAEARRRAARLGIEVCLPKPLPLDAVTTVAAGAALVPAPDEPQALHTLPDPEPASEPAASEPAAPEPTAPPRSGPEGEPAADEDGPSWLLSGMPEDWQGKYYCNMPWRRIYVGLGGEAFPCCAPTRPIVGNVFQQGFFEIWNGAEYRALREGLYNGNPTEYCRACPYLQQTGATPYDETKPAPPQHP